MLKHLRIILPALVLMLSLGARVYYADSPVLDVLRGRAFDFFQQLSPRPYDAELPVRVIAIDEEAIRTLGQWPWPRTTMANLINRLQHAGAAAIALDVIMTEPDRTSPLNVISTWPDIPETQAIIAAAQRGDLPDNDLILSQIIGQGAVVLAFDLTHSENASRPVVKTGVAYLGESPANYITRWAGVTTSLSIFEAQSAGNGGISVDKDPDGVLRTFPLVYALPNAEGAAEGDGPLIVPSLAMEALRVAQGASTIIIRGSGADDEEDSGGLTGVRDVKNGALVIPTDPHGDMILWDAGHQPERFISAADVLSEDFDPNLVAGRILFIGATATGLFDTHTTPIQETAYGVEQHAQMVEQMVTQQFLHRPLWANAIEIAYLLLLGVVVLAGFVFKSIGARGAAILGVLVLPSGFAVGWFAFTQNHFLIDPLTPTVVGFAVYLTAAMTSFLASERERQQIRSAFGLYLSPALVERLADNPGELKLGGEERELTLLFCDVRNFTTISEALSAEEITKLMNAFLTPMSDEILDHGGTIDKFMGDAIMAFWNAPLQTDNHPRQAMKAAIAMYRRMAQVNEFLKTTSFAHKLPPDGLRMGIGLNTGICSVGNMGSDQRFDYSAIGDTVNLASRLEGQSKTYSLPLLVSETTWAATKDDFSFIEVDLIQVKGKLKPIAVYTPLDLYEAEPDPVWVETNRDMIAAYRSKDWAKAQAAQAICAQKASSENLGAFYELYRTRLEHFAANPPPESWNGVFVAESK